MRFKRNNKPANTLAKKGLNTSLLKRGLLAVLTLGLVACNLPSPEHIETDLLSLADYHLQITDNQLRVAHSAEPEHYLWSSPSHGRILTARSTRLEVKDSRSSYTIKENSTTTCHGSAIESSEVTLDAITFFGSYTDCEDLLFTIEFRIVDGQLQFNAWVEDDSINHLTLNYDMSEEEHVFGFGEQFTYLNLNGQDIPVLTQEQGVGRGEPLLSTIINLATGGSAGTPLTSYYAVPQYITSERRSLFLENSEYSRFDLTALAEAQVHSFSNQMSGRILYGDSLLALVSEFTVYSGRMKALPDWVHQGAILGLQGGTDRVMDIWQELHAADTPIAGLWLQDWVGKRETLGGLGSQLWWNWELDEDRYPRWTSMLAELEQENVRVMGYINPFLVDATEKNNVQRNLYFEALENDYLVKDLDGNPFPVTITDFDAGIVDLTNEDARTWLKEIIKTQLIGNGFSGWMADFGEALPFDVTLADGRDGFDFHNDYPVEWAKLNAEAVAEAGLTEEITFFMRSGFTQSPAYSTLFWLGDQTVTWDHYDGLESAIIGLMNGGFSGISLNHSDIGGYTSLALVGKLGLVRTESLMLRWIEANAFSAIYRTHEGLAPQANKQVYSNAKLINQFAKFGKVFRALFDYRKELFVEAETLGYPVVRHPVLHYPDDPFFLSMGVDQLQFMLGDAFMVAPITYTKDRSREVHLPQGEWVHLWSGASHLVNDESGLKLTVAAPFGEPPVFFRADSASAQEVYADLLAQGLAEEDL